MALFLAFAGTDAEHVGRERLVATGVGAGRATVSNLPPAPRWQIKIVCDLRTAEEIHRGPDRVPKGATEISADVLADDADLIHTMMTGGAAPKGPSDQRLSAGRRGQERAPIHAQKCDH